MAGANGLTKPLLVNRENQAVFPQIYDTQVKQRVVNTITNLMLPLEDEMLHDMLINAASPINITTVSADSFLGIIRREGGVVSTDPTKPTTWTVTIENTDAIAHNYTPGVGWSPNPIVIPPLSIGQYTFEVVSVGPPAVIRNTLIQSNTPPGASGVTSFEGRTGVVVSAPGDYTASEITNVPSGNLLTPVVAGLVPATNVQQALNYLQIYAPAPHAQASNAAPLAVPSGALTTFPLTVFSAALNRSNYPGGSFAAGPGPNGGIIDIQPGGPNGNLLLVSVEVATAALAAAADQELGVVVLVNGVSTAVSNTVPNNQVSGVSGMSFSTSGIIRTQTGDVITVQVLQTTGAPLNFTGGFLNVIHQGPV